MLGIDTGYYKQGWLYNGVTASVETLAKDVRHVTVEDLAGSDAVVHMAELSNDPLGELIPDVTYEVNHKGSVRLAELAKQAGVQRFVYMSSCSVYGVAEGTVDETSAVNPQTAYAECKALVERDVAPLADDDFSPVFMRNATAFGASPRQRFDIVLNNLAGLAYTTGKIAMTSDGSPWRPLVHGLDIAKAIRGVLDAPREAIHDQVFNVGDSEQNYQVRDIAEAVGRALPGPRSPSAPAQRRQPQLQGELRQDPLDPRGLLLRLERRQGRPAAHRRLRGDRPRRGDLHRAGHTRLKQLEHLLRTEQIDEELFWRTQPVSGSP